MNIVAFPQLANAATAEQLLAIILERGHVEHQCD